MFLCLKFMFAFSKTLKETRKCTATQEVDKPFKLRAKNITVKNADTTNSTADFKYEKTFVLTALKCTYFNI